MKTKELHQKITEFIQQYPKKSSKEIHEGLNIVVGYATIKRALQALEMVGVIQTMGQGKATKYQLNPSYGLLSSINPDDYFKQEVDERIIKKSFNLELIAQLSQLTLFNQEELSQLNNLQTLFSNNIKTLSQNEYQKEFERLAIDLSWKSSQIEGNTYSLLETERLLKDQETAAGKTKDEAIMLLNHKNALDFMLQNPDYLNELSIARIEDIHSLLIQKLNVTKNIRKRRVGISGTNYIPLDNEHQIREALEELCYKINQKENVFEKALLVLLFISYIQPFNDGNKRIARIISNAVLISAKYCPLSFRTVSALDYKKAMLLFCEQNNISAFKKIWIGQYEFAVKTYF